ncbi:MAG: DUF6748 domain-containing protein [Archangium sp.]
MRTILLVGAVFFAACGVSEAELNESNDVTAEEAGELGTSTRSYVTFRYDLYRRCAWPRCGGIFVRDVNRATVREEYVLGWDFSQSNLSEEVQADVASAAGGELIVYGKLGRTQSNGFRSFIVTSVWRGMPGVTVGANDTFYSVGEKNIRCITAPCPTLEATKLHTTQKTLFSNVDVSPAAKPLVDTNWLTNRVINDGAIVAGNFVNGQQVGTGIEKNLAASQVFIKLPDMTRSCGRPFIPTCPAGQTVIWARDANRCMMPAGCGGGGACTAQVPTCEDGYELMSWTGGRFACTQYACDPTFMID